MPEPQIDYQQLVSAMMETFKVAGTTPNAVLGHGPGGPFSTPGINARWFNAMALPNLGLIGKLAVRASIDINPLHAILTGVTAESGSNPSSNCDPCKVPGNLKRCLTTATFGRLCLSTPTIDLSGNLGALNNRGEFRDFQLVGDPFGQQSGRTGVPTTPGGNGNPLNSEVAKQMWQFKVGWMRLYSKLLYAGNPVNNVGAYAEPRGLDMLINTGYQDAEMGTLCPAANSLVRSFGANVASNGPALVNEVTYIWRYLNYLAGQTGQKPVRFTIVMPPMMWYEISAIWPCAYNTSRCAVNANSAIASIDVNAQRQMVDEMRAGNYLLIDGEKVEVTLDDSATTTELNGTWTGQMYFVPISVQGGIPSTYTEYFDFDNGGAQEARNLFGIDAKYTTSDAGQFLWARRVNGFCVSMDSVNRPRVILETPFLAARLTGIAYTPLIATRSGYTGDSNFYNGGVYRDVPAPSFYPPTIYSDARAAA